MGALLSVTLLTPLAAQTINWSNVPNAAVDINFDSEGVALDGGTALDPTFFFELGVFDLNYDPAIEDPSTWFDSWTMLDEASYNTDASFFGSTYHLADNTYDGRQAYIWGFNQNTVADDTAEWVLITDADGIGDPDWIIPTKSDQLAIELEWGVQNATTVVFGGLNDTPGPGEFETEPPSYELQTHTFPVPEPGMISLFGIAAMLGMRRRRSRAPA